MNDKLVFDIETKNSFADVGGRENLKALDISVLGVYSYNEDRFFCFDENELNKFGEMAKNSKLLIGFSSKRFDIPVIEKYFNFKISAVPHFDILEEIEKTLGRRVGLDVLAQANLGTNKGKTAKSMDAILYYKQGDIEKLKNYCLQDVKITKELFELIKVQGYLWIPEYNIPQMTKLPIQYKEDITNQIRLL